MEKKLVMTLLVRDEEDILEDNICFHLNQGVDYIVAMDNGSVDRTPQILEKYAQKGVLSYTINNTYTKEQGKWVSQMAKRAVEEFGATHLFHCDADEFWFPAKGDLKRLLPEKDEVFYVNVVNYLPDRKNIKNWDFNGFNYLVNEPYIQLEGRKNDNVSLYFLSKYSPKVLTSSAFTKIAQGNHNVISRKPFTKVEVNNIFIHHFPVRSYNQFKQKVINSGSAYKKNPKKVAVMGWHIKGWYKQYEKGTLRKEYATLIIPEEKRKHLTESGVLKKVTVPNRIKFASKQYDGILPQVSAALPEFISKIRAFQIPTIGRYHFGS